MKSKIKKAAALNYDTADAAPRITALGKGEIAERIIKTAMENNVPVFENSELVETLTKLEIGDQIPPEFYTVVAEILVFISKIDRIKGETHGEK
ncbi:MAG: EscU/YscU/HrcU family type III secretion system export apparatus switch protein [Caulobacteraceae bacterium]